MYEIDLKALEKKYKLHDFPLNIALEPTTYCNLNCAMCSHDKITRKKGTMDIRLYKKIVDEIAQENPYARLWLDYYGEPLLTRYKLYYMIDYAKKQGLKNIALNTNGLLMDEEMSEMLLDSGLDYLSLDCDGFSDEVYESVRRGGNRDKFYKNAEYLLTRRDEMKNTIPPHYASKLPIIDVKVIEMPQNQHEVSQIMDYWRNKGAWTAKRRMISWGGGNELASFENDSRIVCGMAVGICVVTWDGKVPLCASDVNADNVVGDLNKESIKEVWQRRNENFVKYHFSHEWDKLPRFCQSRNDWHIAGEERFDENGNPVNKNYNSKGTVFDYD